MKKFNWSLVGTVVAIYLFFIGLLITSTPRELRSPFFTIDQNRNQLLNPNNVSTTPGIKMFKKDTIEIKNTVNSLRFYFWNTGKLPIKPENIIKDIEFSFKDTTVEVIDYKVIKKTRDVIDVNLYQIGNNTIGLKNFNIFDYKDGFSCQLIYEGKLESEFTISGAIEGVARFSDLSTRKRRSIRFPLIMFAFLSIPVLLYIGIIHDDKSMAFNWERTEDNGSKPIKMHTPMQGRIFMLAIIFMFSIGFPTYLYYSGKRNIKKNTYLIVPKELI